MNEIQLFDYNGNQVREINDINGEPWFLAMDVCDVLEIRSDTIPVILDSDEHLKVDPNSIGVKVNAPHGVTLISESGLYSLTMRSRKPQAKKFRKWVTSEVLPEIRRSGKYKGQMVPQTFAEALRLAANQQEKIEHQSAKLAEQQPKAEFYDRVTQSDDTYDIGEVAKMLNIPMVGRNNLFKVLRKMRLLMENNRPYQRYVDRGYFKLVQAETHLGTMPKVVVYQRGIEYIMRKLEEAE